MILVRRLARLRGVASARERLDAQLRERVEFEARSLPPALREAFAPIGAEFGIDLTDVDNDGPSAFDEINIHGMPISSSTSLRTDTINTL